MNNEIKNILKPVIAIAIGCFIVLLILEIIIRSFAWYQTNKNIFKEMKNEQKTEIRILTLGDSMTALGGKNSYPNQLENILNNYGLDKKVNIINGGISGSTSFDLTTNLLTNINRYQPDIVITMIGENDLGPIEYEKYLETNHVFRLKALNFIKLLFENYIFELEGFLSNTVVRVGKILSYFNIYENIQKFIFEKTLEIRYNFQAANRLIALLDKNQTTTENKKIFLRLGKDYYARENHDMAEYYLQGLTNAKNSSIKRRVLEILSKIYIEQGEIEKAEKLKESAIELTRGTMVNYQKIASVLKQKQIPLVAVQYPTRDLNILKTYLADFSDTYFVDNGDVFDKAIKQYGYDALFVDSFAGDFGHGSAIGNKIIAEDVAKVIIEEVLKINR